MINASGLSGKILIHTDIFLDHLQHHDPDAPSLLRAVLKHCFGYTTVFTAIELFSLAKTRSEELAVEHSMAAIKLLGLNARSAKVHGKLLAGGVKLPRFNLLIAGVAIESKLPVLTMQPNEFRGVKQMKVISGRSIKT